MNFATKKGPILATKRRKGGRKGGRGGKGGYGSPKH